MVCLHGSDEQQQAIADALSKQAEDELGRSKETAIGHAAGTAAESIVNADHLPRPYVH